MCETELNSLLLFTLLHGAERYLRDVWATVRNLTLLTPQYCSRLSFWGAVVSPRCVSHWMTASTGAWLRDVDSCLSGRYLIKHTPQIAADLGLSGRWLPQVLLSSGCLLLLQQYLCFRKTDLCTWNSENNIRPSNHLREANCETCL